MFTYLENYVVRENDGRWRAFTASGRDLGTYATLAELAEELAR